MKKRHSYLVLFVALLLSGAMEAKVNSLIGAYAHVGEWTLIPSGSDYTSSFGAAGGAGFLYELQAGPNYSPTQFLLDVGVGAQYGMTAFKKASKSYVVLEDQRDLDYQLHPDASSIFDYVYEFQNRRDEYTDLAVQIPLMVGVQHHKFYMLAGVKFGAHVLTKANITANYNTFGRYQDASGKPIFNEFRNMPEYQFFSDQKIDQTTKTTFNFTADLSLEIGGRLGLVTDAVGYDVPKRNVEYRLAGFVDYGLLDIHKSRELAAYETPQLYDVTPASPNYVYNTRSMVEGIQVNDIMSTTGFANKVSNLMIGIKFTVLFRMPEPGQCVICRDAYRRSARPRSGRLKYEE